MVGRRGKPYTAVAIRQAWERIRERAGLPDVRFHDLRRKTESDLPLEHAAALLAHAEAKVTARHYHAKPVSVRPAR
jgi:integrase